MQLFGHDVTVLVTINRIVFCGSTLSLWYKRTDVTEAVFSL
jgi:hypothetical protein